MRERRSPDMAGRVAAAEAAVARFAGQPFAWGRNDCLRIVAFALRELGHAPPLRMAGNYKTLLGAHRALKRTGHATLDGWVDAWGLLRIPPAAALPGDVLAFPSEVPTMPALALALSNGRVLACVAQLSAIACVPVNRSIPPIAAWSA